MKSNNYILFVAAVLCFFFQKTNAQQTSQSEWTITGKVLTSDQKPLPGVSILLKRTKTVTTTNTEGMFSIKVPQVPGELVYAYIGMKSQTVAFQKAGTFTIVLEEENSNLNEVIVVGYGTQKKENLTGAVDQVTADVFKNRPITNLAQGLQGAMPNLNLTPADGKPNQSPAFNIRGATSVGQGGSALVLIDGVEGNPALLNPHDIETVSILKDAASAAIYGARGAFGVVLITTKKPVKDRTEINYSSNYAVKNPTTVPNFVTDGYQWASMFNEAFSSWNNYASTPQNVNKTLRFSQEYLSELKKRSLDPSLPKTTVDPVTGEYVYYENHNWMDDLYKDHTYSLDQNISVSGSSNKTSFYLTGRYLDQPGLFRYNSDDYKMYNLRAKGSIELYPWLTLGNNTDYSSVQYHTPMNVGEGGGIWRNMSAEGPPMAPMFNPDGTLTHSAAYTVGDYWYGKNGMDYDRRVLRNSTNFATKFFDNTLRIKGDFTFQNTLNNESRVRVPVPYSRVPGVVQYLGLNYNDIREIFRETQYINTNIYGEYEKTFNNKHDFKVLAGFNYELSTYKRVGAERNGLIYEDAEDLNLALGQSIAATGGYEQWNISGGFFRFNYAYDKRYLIEINGRYDGSSKFPKNERYAFFPSISAGWRISSEPFWKVSKNIISDLKVRASYGSLGNGNIGSYVFQELLSLNTLPRIINGVQPAYTRNPNVIPYGLTWETATTSNVGLDMSLFNNKLSISGDAYIRKTIDMFTPGVEQPAIFGASSPRGNYADMETKGWELSVNWNDHFTLHNKPFNYSVKAVVSDNVSTILKYNNPSKRLDDYYVGQRLGEIWGYATDGFFTSADEIRRSADQSLFSSTATGAWRTGDIKFKDINNDGVIDYGNNTADAPGDRVIIGNDQPRYRFGLSLGADWNNFFISGFLQGVGKQAWYPSRGANTFWGQYNAPYGHPPASQIGNIWTEENPDAYFPRYTGYLAWAAGGTLREVQTRYLQNIAYVRLKNIQVGYTLPASVSSKIRASKASIYFSGENLFTFSPMHKITKDIDVENTGDSDQDLADSNQGDGFNYPMMKSYSVGISITF
ncbi:SusC/RagA family TonB-linked outer membrane protein [Pedobacter nyackensis]|uniref:TonB-linked outer membrane protein, SusC/RagA family n=1 Tax=Pedobacter nyackensis TaxID=475255 RepID=A0A1W2CMN9_9SPHI|nr:TonB-dependent receptor [Pedobacter nyackensis]SMC86132.1 TonB-linked outer membrane protein, SusC/RagA family [Pedobacter nyackensis]